MRKPTIAILAGIAAFLLLVVQLAGSAQTQPVQYWTIAKSSTWDGTPDPRVRYMATTGLSEWSTGLQLGGFRGASDLEVVEAPIPPGVRKFVRATALKARVTGVFRQDAKISVQVKPEDKGYEVVAVDVSNCEPESGLIFVFVDPSGAEVARNDVLIE